MEKHSCLGILHGESRCRPTFSWPRSFVKESLCNGHGGMEIFAGALIRCFLWLYLVIYHDRRGSVLMLLFWVFWGLLACGESLLVPAVIVKLR
jgi:hypothetical protein